MKKMFAALCVLLLVPTRAAADGERVSIAELRRQAEAMGRWQKTYETSKGTLDVDIPILVPETETCPVITVERTVPLTDALYERITSSENTKMGTYLVDMGGGETWEYYLMTDDDGKVYAHDRLEAVWNEMGAYRYSFKDGRVFDSWPITGHYPWEIDMDRSFIRDSDLTINQMMAIWRKHIAANYPNESIVIAPKRITANGSKMEAAGKKNKKRGEYEICGEQVLNGFPIFGALGGGDFQVFHTLEFGEDKIWERLKPYEKGIGSCNSYLVMHAMSAEDYFLTNEFVHLRTVEIEDIPLAPLDEVLANIEREIETGRIRKVLSLRLGYMLYSNPDMENYAWAVPQWVLECQYVTEKEEKTIQTFYRWNKQDGNLNVGMFEMPDFTQIPIDAQSAEMLIFEVGSEELYAVPEIEIWEDVRGRWTQTYTDAYGRQVEVDIQPIMPTVEAVPMVRVEPMDVSPDQIQPDMPLIAADDEEGSRCYYDSATGEWMRLYEMNGNAVSVEYAAQDTAPQGESDELGSLRGKSFCVDEAHLELSCEEASAFKKWMQTLDNVMERLFPDEKPEYGATWLEEVQGSVPCRVVTLRQKIEGIPVLMGADDPIAYASEAEIGFRKPQTADDPAAQLCNRLEADEKMIAASDGSCRIQIAPMREIGLIAEDVPLCSFDKVRHAVEERILSGHIRRVYALRFGYCCYRASDGGNVLAPVWQIECDYAFDPAKAMEPDDSYPIAERAHYSTMIVDAQTGEFVNPAEMKNT